MRGTKGGGGGERGGGIKGKRVIVRKFAVSPGLDTSS